MTIKQPFLVFGLLMFFCLGSQAQLIETAKMEFEKLQITPRMGAFVSNAPNSDFLFIVK